MKQIPNTSDGIDRITEALMASAGSRRTDDGNCLDDVALAELADGTTPVELQQSRIAHLVNCAYCRREYAALAALLADAELSAELREVGGRRRPSSSRNRIFAVGGALAAAVVLFMFAWPRMPQRGGDAHRGPTIAASPAPALLSPVGDVASAAPLEWAAVDGADRYRVTLFDAGGKTLIELQLTDTTLTLPDSVVLTTGRSYLWKVEAHTGWDRWSSSELVEFRLVPAPDITSLPTSAPHFFFVAQAVITDSLSTLASRVSDSALVVAIKRRPSEVRDALIATLAQTVHGEPGARVAALGTAHRLARAYAVAWNDDFLEREVTRFAGWPSARRATKVSADSMRRAGITAFSRDGARAAIAIWRRALSRSVAIGDTAGMAATLANIGAGFARDGQRDSAQRVLDRARTLAQAVGDLRVDANATSELAGVDEQRGDIAGARERYARAIALRERIGDTRGIASDYNNLAGVARAAGDFAEARRDLEAALDLNKRDGRDDVAATNLVNLAALASISGDFARAERLYRDALAVWRPREQWADVADAARGLGALDLRRGDYSAARADFSEARDIYDRTGPFADALAVRQQLAETRAAQGELQDAVDELGRVQRAADSARVGPDIRAPIALARADLSVQLNRRPEAERLYASAESLFVRAGDRSGGAEAQQGAGMLLVDEGNALRARERLESALHTEVGVGNVRDASLTRLWLGELSLRAGDTTAARHQLARAAADLEHAGDPVAAAAALGQQGTLELSAGFPAAADSLFRAALSRMDGRAAPEVTWRLHAGLGAVRKSRGALDDAARELRAAIADIERSGRSLSLAERRSWFLTDKWDVYVELALLERARGRVAAAFDVSERARSGEMLELLSQGRVAAPPDTSAELVTREQDLRRRIGELTLALERPAGGNELLRGPDVSRAGAVTREALLHAQDSYTELSLEMRERAPRHAALVSRETAEWSAVARRLGAHEALIEYVVSDASSFAFVITRDTLVAVSLGVGRHDLSRLVDFTRGTLQPRGPARLDSLWRAPLRQLHRDLIAPIEATGFLTGKTRLIVVPHAELHYLPFAALMSGDGKFLVERYEVVITPSASVWLTLGNRPANRPTAGYLAFAPRPDVLPASRNEVEAIARYGGADAKVVIGKAATEAAFRRDAPSRRVIHLATYGVLNKQNPLFSFVELAPDAANDGRLEAHEVFGLYLTADLVVLSACQTALASGALTDVPAGDDWIGLARAFLSAGAARVMASLWPVQDRATAALMERFYQQYTTTGDAAGALAAAQRALLSSPATASPYYWAGFELVGGR